MFAGLNGMKDCGMLSAPRKERHPARRSEMKGALGESTLAIILATSGWRTLLRAFWHGL